MRKATTVVVGAGHAGLAMSRCLSERGIDHVVLERGEVANSWRTERWDSLRLLTPNWQSRLPGLASGDGADPDGFRTMPEVVELITRYAGSISAPVRTHTRVTSVRRTEAGYMVATDGGDWHCRTVVLASGACNVPCVPKLAQAVPASIATLTPRDYRNPGELPDGGVLVVGASATGVQLAREIRRSGRPVILAVGEHVRVPRTYRGRDILWWLDRAGVLDQRHDEVDDIERVRRLPSFQLAGSPEREALDLNALAAAGVELVGRIAGAADGRLQFSGSLTNLCALADLKMARLLDAIDSWASANGLDGIAEAPSRPAPTVVPGRPRLDLDLARGEVATIVWATGFRPDHSWLDVPVLDRKGRLRHEGGVVTSPGLYALGLPFLRRRKSTLIDGAGDDARDLADHLLAYLDGDGAAARGTAARWRSAA
jgi:putative flavoprotein involved in K+ transport